MSRVTLKKSTIFISVGDKTRIYHSVDQVPPALRKKLEQSTNGLNSATILIADRRGRQELARAIRGLPAAVRAPSAPAREGRPADAGWRLWRAAWGTAKRLWLEFLLPPALGAAVWLIFRYF